MTAACHSDSVSSSGQKVRCVLPCSGSAAMYVHGEGLSVWHVGMWGMSGLSQGGAQNETITRSFVGRLSLQVSDPPTPGEGASEDPGRSLRSRMDEKWLNVVLDLNGILCVCEDWKSNRNTK